MNFSESLKKNKDFQVVYREKNSYANKYLIMYIKKNGLNKNRIGISASKKVGNSVVRHRITRRIRESYRTQEARFAVGIDIIIIARPGIGVVEYANIRKALIHVGKLHNIIN